MSSSHSKDPKKREAHDKSDSHGDRNAKKGSANSRSSHSSGSSPSEKKRSHSRSNKHKPYYNDNARGYQERIEPSTKLFVTNIDSKVFQQIYSSLKKNSTETWEHYSNPLVASSKSLSKPNKEAAIPTALLITTPSRQLAKHKVSNYPTTQSQRQRLQRKGTQSIIWKRLTQNWW
jgi:hypothetical protein